MAKVFDARLEQLRAIRNREKEREERERKEEEDDDDDKNEEVEEEQGGRMYSEVSPLRATPSTSHRPHLKNNNNIEEEEEEDKNASFSKRSHQRRRATSFKTTGAPMSPSSPPSPSSPSSPSSSSVAPPSNIFPALAMVVRANCPNGMAFTGHLVDCSHVS